MWPRAAAEEGRGQLVTRSGLNPARLTQVRVKGMVREVSCSSVQPVFVSLELSQRVVREEVQQLEARLKNSKEVGQALACSNPPKLCSNQRFHLSNPAGSSSPLPYSLFSSHLTHPRKNDLEDSSCSGVKKLPNSRFPQSNSGDQGAAVVQHKRSHLVILALHSSTWQPSSKGEGHLAHLVTFGGARPSTFGADLAHKGDRGLASRTLVNLEPVGLDSGGPQPAPASSGRCCTYSGQISGGHSSKTGALPTYILELLGVTGGNIQSSGALPWRFSTFGHLRRPPAAAATFPATAATFPATPPAKVQQLLHFIRYSSSCLFGANSSGILGVGTADGVAVLTDARRDPTNLVSEPPWSVWRSSAATLEQISDSASLEELRDRSDGRTTQPLRLEGVQPSPEIEADPSTGGERPMAELDTQAVGRMVQLENEVLMLRQEMSEQRQQLSKLNEIQEIKEMLRAMNANQVVNPRPAPAPPSQVTPPPRTDKQKGVLGGHPSADPTPPSWQMQAGPSRPSQGWNPEHFEDYHGTNGGHTGQHVDPTVNIGGPSGHHSGFNGNNGGQQHSTSGYGNRETYGPQASHYGSRFPRTQWENAHTERRQDFDIDLRNLKQTSTVQEYQERFEDLACMVDWTEKALIAAFVGGLKDEIQVEVRAEPNIELDRCFVKARAAEDRLQKLREIYRPWKTSAPVRGREQPQRPKQLPAPVKKEVPKPVYRSRLPPNMTQEEREELIRNKKCFWCKNDWNSTHQCKHIRVYTVQQESYEVKEGGQPLEIEVIEEAEAIDPNVDPKAALKAIRVQQPVAWPYRILKHRWVTRNGRPRHEVMIEWEGIDGGTSWELFDKIKTQFPTGAWGQAPFQEGGSDTGQPSTWPRAATDVAESSRRGRKRSARHSVRAEPSSIDPGAGQGDGEGGELQLGSAGVRQLGVVTEGGAGGSATARSKAKEFQGGGSSSSVFKPTQAVFEPDLAHKGDRGLASRTLVNLEPVGLDSGGPQPAPASSGRRCTYSGQISGGHSSKTGALPTYILELLGVTSGNIQSFGALPWRFSTFGHLRRPPAAAATFPATAATFPATPPAKVQQLLHFIRYSSSCLFGANSSGILGVGTADGVAVLTDARRDPTTYTVHRSAWLKYTARAFEFQT
ncbi:hypothetical protein EJ110_NYTH49591 [Nymphaea thermarum]|nr:hypothetical protein EJ110_NYTH49591 [Nymphaea thermarum]